MWTRTTDFLSRHVEKIVLILAITFSIVSFIYYYSNAYIVAYGDARAHLDISRRIVDSLTPGVAQLGGYWLPLLHVLMLPTIWNDFMWQSGLSGSVPSMIAFVIAVVFMFRLVFYITNDKLSAFIGSSVLLFNPNLLYIQAAPMTESLFVMAVVGFMYYFYRWFQEKLISDLVISAIFLILASLNRYEGWGLVIAANVLMIWYWVQSRFDRKIEGAMFAFASLSFLGIFLWLLWGAVIFHDPLEFMHNAWRINNIAQEDTVDSPKWIGDGNILGATIVNGQALILVGGYVLFVLGTICLLLYVIKNFRALRNPYYLLPLLLFVPFLFDVVTVYYGKIPITIPDNFSLYSGVVFNVRYALFTLPALALLIALAIQKKTIFQYVALLLIISGYIFVVPADSGKLAVLRDISVDRVIENKNENVSWFKNNYDGGLILISAGGNDSFMFQLGFKQKTFIHEGAYKYWEESLRDPSKHATWVVISDGNLKDSLAVNINRQVLAEKFELKKESGKFMFFKRIHD